MKTIIAGSRTINDYYAIVEAINKSGFDITEIISGGARGVDRLGEEYAKNKNIPLTIMKADWGRNGRSAGYVRNIKMAEVAEALIAISLNDSPGTRHMIKTARDKGLKVFVSEYTKV